MIENREESESSFLSIRFVVWGPAASCRAIHLPQYSTTYTDEAESSMPTIIIIIVHGERTGRDGTSLANYYYCISGIESTVCAVKVGWV